MKTFSTDLSSNLAKEGQEDDAHEVQGDSLHATGTHP